MVWDRSRVRTLDVRRHSLTKKGPGRGRGSQLSQAGVELAATWSGGPYARVVTSHVPRAVETALAMGCAVDETVEFPDWYREPGFPRHAQWAWPDPFAQLGRLVRADAELRAVAEAHLGVWTATVQACADGEEALLVGHGGAVELALVAALPHASTAGWGPPLAHGEGVRLEFRDGAVTALRFLSADGRVDVVRTGWGAPAPAVAPAGTGDRS